MRRFYIHAGLPKTGTSYLQSVFFESREALAEQDLALLPARQQDHLHVALDVRHIIGEFDSDSVRTAMSRFRVEVEESTAGRALLTQEALAPLRPQHGPDLISALGDAEVHVIFTARDPGRQLPSAWQQKMQGRLSYPYREFLDDIVARGPLSVDLWNNQDLGQVLRHWSEFVDPSRIHVVTGPPPGAARGLLLERFCSVVGVDPATLDATTPTANTSLGQAQAEILRRVNLALGDRFPHSRAGYLRLGQAYLAGRVLQRQQGEPARLPASLRPWADELADGWIEQIRAGGFDVVGDLEELRNRDASFEETPTDHSEGELLDVAAAALADVLDLRNDELDAWEAERRRLRHRVNTLREERDALQARTPRGLAGQVMRKVTRRR